jgi:uncharacterized protein
MRLNLKDIIHVPGAMRPFFLPVGPSDLEFGGARPIGRPVTVEGRVRNMAGALVLEAEAKTVLDLTCDRCARPFAREKIVPIETLLATELADETNEDEIYLLDGDEVDLDEVPPQRLSSQWIPKTSAQRTAKASVPGAAPTGTSSHAGASPR